MTSRHTPPASAEFVAGALMPDDTLRDDFLGDLAEAYDDIASCESVRSANRWYLLQVGRSVVPLSLLAISRRGPLSAMQFVGSVVAGVGVVWTIMVAGIVGFVELFVLINGGDGYRGAMAVGEYLRLLALWSVFTGIIAGFAAGFVSALIGRPSAFASAIVLGVASVSLVVTAGSGSHTGFIVFMSVIVFSSIVAGAWRRMRTAALVSCA